MAKRPKPNSTRTSKSVPTSPICGPKSNISKKIVVRKKASGTQILGTLKVSKASKNMGWTAARTAKKKVR